MAEAEAVLGVVKNFTVAGIERDSLRVDQFVKDEETDLSGVTVTDNEILGVTNLVYNLTWFNYAAQQQAGGLQYNVQAGAEQEVNEGYAGMLETLAAKFDAAYGDDAAIPYRWWGNPNGWVAKGVIQECVKIYREGQFNNQQWLGGPYLKVFNAGHMFFTSVFPHATGMSLCLINYNSAHAKTANRGFYTDMQSRSDYYPLNFKANEEDGWKPQFHNNQFGGFGINWPYKALKNKYDDAGEVQGKEEVLCGEWLLPQMLWNVGKEIKRYPIQLETLTGAETAEAVKCDKNTLRQTKFDFAGNINYKLTTINIGKDEVDGHRDVYVMGESNKEIIVAGKFREGILIANFATKEHPPNKGRKCQFNKANAYRVQQFFAGLIEKGFVTCFAEDSLQSCFK